MEDNFFTELVQESTRGGARLDLLLTKNWEVRSCLGQGDDEMAKFSILNEVRRGASKTATLDFQRANYELFRTLLGRIPWESVLKGSKKAGQSSSRKS